MLKVFAIAIGLLFAGNAFAGSACLKAKSEDSCASHSECQWDTAKNKCQKAKNGKQAASQKKAEEVPAAQEWEMDFPAQDESDVDFDSEPVADDTADE